MSAKSTMLAAALASAVTATVARTDVAAQPQAIPALVEAVMPIAVNAANAEPWYRSRVTWGAIASIALPILGAFGVTTDIIDADQVVTIGMAIGAAAGGLLTLYGRWKAKRPIGQ